jgi:hypothetical protein
MITAREAAELQRRIVELEEEIETLREKCESQCFDDQVSRLIKEFDIPSCMLETDYFQETLESRDLNKIRRLLSDRHRMFYGVRVVEGEEIE